MNSIKVTLFQTTVPPPPTKGETREQREERKRQEKKDYADSKLEEKVATCKQYL